MAQKLLLMSAARLLTTSPCAFTKPMSAWLRAVSTVTSPVCFGDVHQANCRVSDTIGLGVSLASNGCVGGPASEEMRTLCWSGTYNGYPVVKYGRSAGGRSMLSKTCCCE